jgi:hypothetical protein
VLMVSRATLLAAVLVLDWTHWLLRSFFNNLPTRASADGRFLATVTPPVLQLSSTAWGDINIL